MPSQTKKEKLHEFYCNLSMGLVGCLKAYSSPSHDLPGTKKKFNLFYQRINKYLRHRGTLTLGVVEDDINLDNMPLPELRKSLGPFIKKLVSMNLQPIVFKRGLGEEELSFFLKLLIRLMKRPSEAADLISKNQGELPHIFLETLQTGDEKTDPSGVAPHALTSLSRQFGASLESIQGVLIDNQVSAVKQTAEAVNGMIQKSEIPLNALIHRKSFDTSPYAHALHVCAWSMALANEMVREGSLIQEIGLSALLHDVGLYLLSTEETEGKDVTALETKRHQWEHPIRGAEILLISPGVPDMSPIVAYEHHIHYDGGGYPKQKRHRDLNMASMITGIADNFDNLRTNRPGQDALSLPDAIEWMDRRFGTQFHPLLFKKFRELVASNAGEPIS